MDEKRQERKAPPNGSFVRTKGNGSVKPGPIGEVVKQLGAGDVIVEWNDFKGYGHTRLHLLGQDLEIVE